LNKTLIKVLCSLVLGLLVCCPGVAGASLIGADAFGAGALTESFEGITPGNGVSTGPLESWWNGTNNFTIGTPGPYTFASGVVFNGPSIPGGSWASNGAPFINDFRFGTGATNTWGQGYNDVTPAVVPSGTAWIGTFNQAGYLEFDFSQKMARVGAYVTGASGTSVTMEAYGDSGLLQTYSISTVPVAQWGTNFIGIEADGITKVIFRDVDFGLDNLTFEQASDVPVPGSLLLLGTGLFSLVLLGKRKSGKLTVQ
jgi:hypothetical protein